MARPIDNKIGTVFIPVSDMRRAVAFYSHLFGLPFEDAAHEGKIYDVAMSGEVGLILDGHRPVTNSSQPLCCFWTSDIWAAEAFLRENKIEIVSGIEEEGSVSSLIFEDLDGNRLMVCQPNY